MAVIDLSAGWVLGSGRMMTKLFKLDGNVPSTYPAVNGLLNCGIGYGNSGVGTICLMKGTPPVSTASQTTINARSSDILCRFQAASNTAGDFLTSQVTVNPAVISTQYVAAIASGTATWFWWTVIPTVSGGTPNDAGTLMHQIIGTVGLTSSGEDLEMASVSIISGELYRIVNLRLQFPTIWTY